MSTLFNITLESKKLTGTGDSFTSAVTNDGDLSVTPAAAMGFGNYGLNCLLDGTQTNIFGQKTQTPPASNELRFRAYIDPNSLAMAVNDTFNFLLLRTPTAHMLRLRWNGTNYEVRSVAYDDAGGLASQIDTITDARHYAEVHIERASTNIAADGRVRYWLDGDLKKTWDNVDNWDVFSTMDHFRLGGAGALDAGTSGTFYCDEFKANDDGSEIGASVRPDLQLLIDGVDHISELVHESLVVHQLANRLSSTCSFDLIITGVVREDVWTVGTTRVEDGDVITGHVAFAEPKVEVSVTDGATVYFAGILSRITVRPKYVVDVRGTTDAAAQIITCHCHDFNPLLEEAIVEREYYADKTDEFIIDDIFDNWVNADPPNYGIGRDAHVDGGAYTIDEFIAEYISVREALDRLAAHTGYEWYVDYDKELHYSEDGDDAPAWHLSDAPDGVNGFSFLDPIEVETDATNLINKAHIRGETHGVGMLDAASIAKYGVHAVVIEDSSLKTSADCTARGYALFAKFANPIGTHKIRTHRDGLRAGMNLRVVCAHLDLNIDSISLIQKLTIKFPVDGDPIYELTLGGLEYSPEKKVRGPVPTKGWGHDLVFTAIDNNTVHWSTGTIWTEDGLEYNIAPAADTGNMTEKNIVYFNPRISETALQVIPSYGSGVDGIGPDRTILAICWPGAILAGFQVHGVGSTGGQMAVNTEVVGAGIITGPKVAALAIDTGHLVDGAVEHAKTNIAKLSDITVDLGIVTAGEFRAYTGDWDVDADGFRLNTTEFAGQENGVDQVVILAADGKLTAGGGAVTLDENGLYLVGTGAIDNPRRILFQDDTAAGVPRTLGWIGSGWAGGANLDVTWLVATRDAGDPWPANIVVVLAAVDTVAGTDVRLTLGSGQVVDFTGEAIVRTDALFRPGTVANAAAEAALASVEDGCLIYRLDTDKLRLRANGAWVDLN